MKLLKDHPDEYSVKLEWYFTVSNELEKHLLYDVATSDECKMGDKGLELYCPVKKIDLHQWKFDSLSAQPSLYMRSACLTFDDEGKIESEMQFE